MADEPNLDATPISMEFQSTHVEKLRTTLETLDMNDEQAKVKVEIEASKVHWSELASSYYTAEEGPAVDSCSTSSFEWVHEKGTPEWKLEVDEDNVRVFRNLQEKYPSGFFFDENDWGSSSTQQLPKWIKDIDGLNVFMELVLSSETPFAEGGQAEFFHAYLRGDEKKREHLVLKVFREGMPLRDLRKSFPITMLTNDETCIEGIFGVESSNLNRIGGVRMLKSNGRFAFLMGRAWGDLRKLIDERMLHFNNQGPPFPNDVALYILHEIAFGVMELHDMEIIHRDLKGANILIFASDFHKNQGAFVINPIDLHPYDFHCLVADFECSIGVVGTRFWRAPEILEAVKNRTILRKQDLFTKEADVYSFGMTCYEVLSGAIPFEKLRANAYDGVIDGARPKLPSQILPWLVDLVNRCWHKDPSMRPPFKEIVEILKPYIPEGR